MGGTGTGWLRPEMLMAPSTYLQDPAGGWGVGGEETWACLLRGRGEEGEGVGVEDKRSAENLDFQIVPGMAAAGVGWVAPIS